MTYFLFLALLAGCCAYALVAGGAPERVAAGLFLGSYAIDECLHRFVDGLGYRSIAVGSFTLDLLLLIGLIVLAWRSNRFWPLWLAGWQAAAIMGHISKWVDPGMLPAGYAIQAQIWAYPMLVALAVGAWRHRRRLQTLGVDAPWKAAVV